MSRREECAIETRKRTVLAWRANTKDILDFCVSLILTVLPRMTFAYCFIPWFADLLQTAQTPVVQVAKNLLQHDRHS